MFIKSFSTGQFYGFLRSKIENKGISTFGFPDI